MWKFCFEILQTSPNYDDKIKAIQVRIFSNSLASSLQGYYLARRPTGFMPLLYFQHKVLCH